MHVEMSGAVLKRGSVPAPVQPIDWARLMAPGGDFVFLDSSQVLGNEMSLLAAQPRRILRGRLADDWRLLHQALKENDRSDGVDLGAPSGGLFGYVGFD